MSVKSVTLKEPSSLEIQIRSTRHALTDFFATTHQTVQEGVETWLEWETSAKNWIKGVYEPKEILLPNLLYVTVSGLGASILFKQRKL
jgi:hypothetical protein